MDDDYGRIISYRRVSELCNGNELMRKKVVEAIEDISKFSIYYRDSFPELNSAMCVTISFFYSLIKKDIELSKFLMSLIDSVYQMRSSWLQYWIKDDFNFEETDVSTALIELTTLIDNSLVNIPMVIYELFDVLRKKYEPVCSKLSFRREHNITDSGSRQL